MGARMQMILAEVAGRPFFSASDGKLAEAKSADPEKALAHTQKALESYGPKLDQSLGFELRDLSALRQQFLVALARLDDAKNEREEMRRRFREAGIGLVLP